VIRTSVIVGSCIAVEKASVLVVKRLIVNFTAKGRAKIKKVEV